MLSGCDLKGGAAKVAYEAAVGLRARGHDVTLLVSDKFSDHPWVERVEAPPVDTRSVRFRLLHRLGLDALNLDSPFPASLGRAFVESFDLIHLHDPPRRFNLRGLAWLARLRPLYWTLHTQQPVTGGCLYSYGCERWRHSCGRCPQFGRWPLLWLHRDGSRLVRYLKQRIYRAARFTPVGVSDWVASTAREGILGHQDVRVIQNMVDTEAFQPRDKAGAKAALGIPPEAKTLLFALSSNPQDTRKGVDIILKALPLLKTQGIFLMPTAITDPGEDFLEIFRAFQGLAPRHLNGPEELSAYYNAAELVWHPTRADTSSLVSLEAFACGTPVLAARVGGVPEVVCEGEGGLLIEPEDPRALAERTDAFFALDATERAALSQRARQRVETQFSQQRFIDDHEALYAERFSSAADPAPASNSTRS